MSTAKKKVDISDRKARILERKKKAAATIAGRLEEHLRYLPEKILDAMAEDPDVIWNLKQAVDLRRREIEREWLREEHTLGRRLQRERDEKQGFLCDTSPLRRVIRGKDM